MQWRWPLWQRDREGRPHTPGQLIHHSDAGSQYTSFKLAEHLEADGIAARYYSRRSAFSLVTGLASNPLR